MKSKSRKISKDANVYPPGWNYQRAKAIAAYYDARKDKPVLDKGASSDAGRGLVWMEVPQELVPNIRKLIARYRKSA